MSHAVNSHPIIAVTCLSFEAQVAAGPGIDVLCGTAQRYVDKLESAVKAGGSGIISIGIAGGLARGLNPGDWVIASGVVARASASRPITAGRNGCVRRCRTRLMPTFQGSTLRS
jgi:phosphorylase superfamily protein